MKTAALLLALAMPLTGCLSSDRQPHVTKPEQRGAPRSSGRVRETYSYDAHVDNWQGAYEYVQRAAEHGE